MLRRFLFEDDGQDILEYGLLAAVIGIAAILIWQQTAATVGIVYGAADTGVQTISACTPDPGGGGCP
jgi:Flp pilus assembly pilin Flp